MRLNIIAVALALSGCAMQDAETRACISQLPLARYTVVDRGTFKSDAIMKIVRGQVPIPDYDIPQPRPSSAYTPQPKSFLLLKSEPDKLVLCEINVRGCSPSLTWLTANDQAAPYRQWTVTKTVEGQCVLY